MPKSKVPLTLSMTPEKARLLRALSEHPFLSRRQMELLLQIPMRTTRHYLRDLVGRGWIQRHNARQPWMHARSLLSLTEQGIAQIAAMEGILPEELEGHLGLRPERYERLLALMERVFQVRTFLLWLQQPSTTWRWSMVHWDVEIAKLFNVKNKGLLVPFHGGAVLARRIEKTESQPSNSPSLKIDGGRENQQEQAQVARWTTIVVEWDLGQVPIEKDRERLVRFVVAQNDPRYWGSANEDAFPVWVIVAQDEFRLQDYYTVIRAASLGRQLPLPRAYLTTFAEVTALRTDPGVAIWHSTVSGQRTSLLSDIQGADLPLPTQAPWRRLMCETRRKDGAETYGVITPEILNGLAQQSKNKLVDAPVTDSAAAISLILTPREKRIFNEVADHPLLAAEEIALVLRLTLWQVRQGLRRLGELGLVEVHTIEVKSSEETISDAALDPDPSKKMRGTQPRSLNDLDTQEENLTQERHALTQKGMRYLAMIAGFGNNLKRYAQARGWLAGLDVLKRHWEHTRQENTVFLAFAGIAQQRHHELIWLSELESRLYYSDSDDGKFRPRRRSSRKNNRTSPANNWAKKEYKKRHHSFLPDGRGTYIADGQRYEFALEIDRGKSSREKFRRKLIEYLACITSNILRGRGIELLRLLVVTRSWERAETLRALIVAVEHEFQCEGLLPVYITTYSRLRATGADAPIWLKAKTLTPGESALTASKDYCFECFVRQPPVSRKPGLTLYTSGY